MTNMNCQDVRGLLHAYTDNELDAMAAQQIEAHMAECAVCRRAFEADRAVKSVLANPALLHAAPASLRGRIRAAAIVADPQRAAGNSPISAAARRPSTFWRNLAVAAAVLIVIGLAWVGPGEFSHLGGAGTDGQEALAAHLRSLQTESHLFDVASSDQHTVKPWFAGRVDFSPPVFDLSDKGFPLIGGRLDYLHQRPVAALVYRRNKHIINVFVWPGESGESSMDQDGYHLVHWSDGGMTFWAVSDLNPAELGQFAGLFRSESSTRP